MKAIYFMRKKTCLIFNMIDVSIIIVNILQHSVYTLPSLYKTEKQ